MNPRPGSTEPGPLAEEAARLAEAFGRWARRAAAGVDPGPEQMATGSPDCLACPVCRMVAALRGEHPEATERMTTVVAEAATVVVGALRTIFDGHHSRGADQARRDTGEPDGSGRVETIQVS